MQFLQEIFEFSSIFVASQHDEVEKSFFQLCFRKKLYNFACPTKFVEWKCTKLSMCEQ